MTVQAPGDAALSYPRLRAVMRVVLAAFYIAAGIAHLLAPAQLLAITPSWVPFAPQVIFITGLFELAASAALLSGIQRKSAGILMALYAVCVWPANFKHAIEGIDLPYISSSWWYHVPRLAFQPVIIWWALFCSGAIEWRDPSNRRGQP
jgi:uncharacterized membrane protein